MSKSVHLGGGYPELRQVWERGPAVRVEWGYIGGSSG